MGVGIRAHHYRGVSRMTIHAKQDLEVLPTSHINFAMNSLTNIANREYIHIEFETCVTASETRERVFMSQTLSMSRQHARQLGEVLLHLARLNDEVSYGESDIEDLLAEVIA